MLVNYIKVALRNLWRHRFFTFINVFGLMLAVAVSLIIYLYVSQELRHDQGLVKKENMHRLLREASFTSGDYRIGMTSAPFAEALGSDFPQEIEQTLRVYPTRTLVRYEEQTFLEENFAFTDPNFFEFFHYSFSAGNPGEALALPNSVVITEKTALKYFGANDPLGKSIRVDDSFDMVVTGVIKQEPGKSHLYFDFLANIAPLRNFNWFSDWWSNAMLTYLVLKEPADPAGLEGQLPAFMDKYFGEDFIRNKNRIDLLLQPTDEIYFDFDIRYDPVAHGNKSTVMILSIIGCFILAIACINFTNLSTAKSMARAREVGIRKTLGSSRMRLVFQFLAEAYLITGLAVVLGCMLVELTLPVVNRFFEIELHLSLLDQQLWLLAAGAIFVLGLLTGAYPAFLMSGFSPIRALKGAQATQKGKLKARKTMVVIQFSIAIFLVTSTLVINDQLDYLNQTDLGFDKENVLLVSLNDREVQQQASVLKKELEQHSAILHTSYSTGEPGGFHDTMAHEVEGMEETLRCRTVFADLDYLKTLGFEIAAGRDFSRAYGTDLADALIINETMAREIGWSIEEAIGKKIRNVFIDSASRTVIGVVKDYHFATLKTQVEPLVISPVPPENGEMLIIRAVGNSPREVIVHLQDQWNARTSYPLAFRFLDNSLDQLYHEERLQANLFGTFSSISVLVACLGIFALATFVVVQRAREMGIRKVLGASVAHITALLTGGFIIPVLIANLLAVPASWYFSHTWLGNFAYRIAIPWQAFFIAALLAAGLAFLSVVFQSLKATRTNPVDVLKEE